VTKNAKTVVVVAPEVKEDDIDVNVETLENNEECEDGGGGGARSQGRRHRRQRRDLGE